MKTPHVVALLFAIVAAVVFVNQRSDAQNPQSRRVQPLSAELAYGSITATGQTGANTLYTLTEDCSIVSFENTTNQDVIALIGPTGATGSAQTKKRVPTQSARTFDLVANYTRWAAGSVVKVYAPTAPTGPANSTFEIFCNPQ